METQERNLSSLEELFRKNLANKYEERELQSDLAETFDVLYGIKSNEVALSADKTFNESEVQNFLKVVDELKEGKPLAYALRHKQFYGIGLYVDKNVLIPRPETEELVDWIIKEAKQEGKIKILDVGTGSGCIAIALKKNLPEAEVTAIDISADALKVAQKSADSHNLEIKFKQMDLFKDELDEEFDIIVSNPPYIADHEKLLMGERVLNNEPHLAMFPEGDDIKFYRKLLQLARENVKKDGWMYWEINEIYADELKELLEKEEFRNVELRRDFRNDNRFIRFTN